MTAALHARRERVAARTAAVLCSGIAGFQVALAAGAPLGRAAWGGAQAELTDVQRVSSAVAALLWGGAAVAFLACSGDLGGTRRPGARGLRRAIWSVAVLSGAGTVLNLASPSPWERSIWAPVALATAVLSVVVARSVEETLPR